MWVLFLPHCMKPLVFFSASFLPVEYGGKIYASFAAVFLSLYVLSLLRGKRYVLSLMLPVLGCALVRFFSIYVYRWVTDLEARNKMLKVVKPLGETIAHHAGKTWEAASAMLECIPYFFQTWDTTLLEPL